MVCSFFVKSTECVCVCPWRCRPGVWPFNGVEGPRQAHPTYIPPASDCGGHRCLSPSRRLAPCSDGLHGVSRRVRAPSVTGQRTSASEGPQRLEDYSEAGGFRCRVCTGEWVPSLAPCGRLGGPIRGWRLREIRLVWPG